MADNSGLVTRFHGLQSAKPDPRPPTLEKNDSPVAPQEESNLRAEPIGWIVAAFLASAAISLIVVIVLGKLLLMAFL